MNSEKYLVAIVLVSIVPQLLLSMYTCTGQKSQSTGCFPIEAFRMHGLQIHELNSVVICLEKYIKGTNQ